MTAPRVLSIGESMVEFFRRDDGAWVQGFAGDTLNVAWALHAVNPEARIDYFSRLGTDGFSDDMVAFFEGAGIGTGRIGRDAARRPGLYTIQTDDTGERHFDYWRGQSAARHLAEDAGALRAALAETDLVYLSGITLAILPPEGRASLLAALGKPGARNFRVAFDSNIRPKLWENAVAMRATILGAVRASDILLPTHEDEAAHFGDTDAATSRARLAGEAPSAEVIVKDGPAPTQWAQNGAEGAVAVAREVTPVDTTGAGDSFNGAYLARRLAGDGVEDAIRAAQGVAAAVIGRRGALIPPEDILKAAG